VGTAAVMSVRSCAGSMGLEIEEEKSLDLVQSDLVSVLG
jgi:hypothetical protein